MVGIFHEVEPRRFGLTPVSDVLRADAPNSMKPLARWICDPFHFRIYAELQHSVKTGQPAADKVYGVPVFEHFAQNPELSAVFNDAMTAMSAVMIPAVLEACDFSGIEVLVDVAGGHGAVLTAILERYPGMRGVLFDLDHVVQGAEARSAALGLADRVRTERGDFFTAVPEGGDAYIMKHIIHDWNDERAGLILRNIHRALGRRENGRVILIESVLAEGNAPDFGKLIDIEMLALPGGRERTADEFRQLFASNGFELTHIVPTRSPLSLVEARAR
jgi:O-methyltransferase domain